MTYEVATLNKTYFYNTLKAVKVFVMNINMQQTEELQNSELNRVKSLSIEVEFV